MYLRVYIYICSCVLRGLLNLSRFVFSAGERHVIAVTLTLTPQKEIINGQTDIFSSLLLPTHSPKPAKSESEWGTRPELTQAQLNRHVAGSPKFLEVLWVNIPFWLKNCTKKSNFVFKPWIVVILVNALQRAINLEKVFSVNLNEWSTISTFPNLRTMLLRTIRPLRNTKLYAGQPVPSKNMIFESVTNFVEMFHKHKWTAIIVQGLD